MRRLLFVVRRPGMCYTVCNRMHERMRRIPMKIPANGFTHEYSDMFTFRKNNRDRTYLP